MDVKNLTDEQLQQLINQMTQEEGEGDKGDEVSYQLPNGETLRGSPEQVNQALLQRLREQEQVNNQPQAQSDQNYRTDQQQQEQYDFNRFQETLVQRKDALDAIRYAFRTQAGFDPVESIQSLGMVVGQIAQVVGDLNKTTAVSRLKDFQATPENVKKLEEIIQARGWQANQQAYEDAYTIAKSTGQLQDTQPQQQQGLPFQQSNQPLPQATQQSQTRTNPYMPNIGQSASEIIDNSQSSADFTPQQRNQLDKLSDDQLLSLIQNLESQQGIQ